MKGDSGVAILLIVLIVVVIGAFLVFSGGSFLSIFQSSGPIVYSNDVIQVANKFVSEEAPYAGQKTSIEFTVKNAGKGAAKGVEVALEPPTGFTSSMKCGTAASCKFDLEEGDAVDVIISLTAAEKDVTQIIQTDVRYSVKYPYKGEREAHIPIVANRNDLPKGQGYFTGDPTYGPIQASFTPPDARPTSDGGSAIFAIVNQDMKTPVNLEFHMSDVGSGGGGIVKPVVMTGDDVKLTLTNLDSTFCDKLDAATDTLKIKADQGSPLLTRAGERLPFDFTCSLDPTFGSKSVVTEGVIKIEFKYNYEISFIDRFSIVPKCTPRPDGTGCESEGIVQTVPTTSSQTGSETATTGGGSPATTTTTTSGGTSTTTGGLPTELSVSTDKSSYSLLQTVKITGKATPGAAGTTVTGRVTAPNGNIVYFIQKNTDSSGSFSDQFKLDGPLINGQKGTYTIFVKSGSLEDTATITVA